MKWFMRVFVVFSCVWGLLAGTILADQAAERLHESALLALSGDDAQRALNLLTEAIAASPRDHRYYNDRGVAQRRTGNLDAALADYSKALELKPDYTNAFNNRGMVYLQQGQFEKAIGDFSQALKYGGIEGKIYTNRGIARAGRGDHQGAIEDFEKAARFPPVDTRSYLYMAESLDQAGDGNKALSMYRLAAGVTSDRETTRTIAQKITHLEQQVGARAPVPTQASASVRQPGTLPAPAGRPAPVTAAPKPSAPARTIVRATPPPAPDSGKPPRPTAGTATAHTVGELLDRCRTTALEKLSPGAVEICRQGMQFIEKADSNKAIVRFEDSRQLERRKKNLFGVAWSDLELGKAYAALGDHLRATPYLEEAFQLFDKINARDETVLTLYELARVNKTAGRKDKAGVLYSQAAEKAGAQGLDGVARNIRDLASGKAPAPKAVEPEKKPTAPENPPAPPAAAPPAEPAAKKAAPPSTAPAPPAVPAAARQTPAAPEHAAKPQSRTDGLKDQLDPRFLPPLKMDDKRLKLALTMHRPGPKPQPDLRGPTQAPLPAARQSDPAPSRTVLPARPPQQQEKPAPAQQRMAPPTAKPPEGTAAASVGSTPPSLDRQGRRTLRTHSQPGGPETTIRADVVLLRELKNRNAEGEMVSILERLGEKLVKKKQFDKALHSMNAALGLRDKLSLKDGQFRAWEQRGLIREQLGHTVEALEDLTRALTAKGLERKEADSGLEARSRAVAQSIGLDATAAVETFKRLWKARTHGNPHGETEALHQIGMLYNAANRPSDALGYFDRSTASLLAEKARIHKKMGNMRAFEELHGKALETFKQLDYSRYLQMMREAKLQDTLSFRMNEILGQ